MLVGLALLPGVIAVLVRDGFAETSNRGAKRLLILAAVYDVPIFLGLLCLHPLGITAYPNGQPFNWFTLVAAIMLAIALGALTGSLWWRKTWQSILFHAGLSRKGIANTWVDSFQDAEKNEAWALVHLKDGRRVFGVPRYYSSSADKPSLYLTRGALQGEPVTIYDASGKRMAEHDGPGVLIGPAAEITLVEFVAGKPVP